MPKHAANAPRGASPDPSSERSSDERIGLTEAFAPGGAERAGEEELEQLKHLLDMQEFFTLKEDGTGIIDTDNHFHEMLYRMSGSLVLHDTLLPLHRKIVKYRQVSVGNSIRAKESFEEHRAIYEAVAAHDPDRAEELLLRHIENARASIMSQEEN